MNNTIRLPIILIISKTKLIYKQARGQQNKKSYPKPNINKSSCRAQAWKMFTVRVPCLLCVFHVYCAPRHGGNHSENHAALRTCTFAYWHDVRCIANLDVFGEGKLLRTDEAIIMSNADLGPGEVACDSGEGLSFRLQTYWTAFVPISFMLPNGAVNRRHYHDGMDGVSRTHDARALVLFQVEEIAQEVNQSHDRLD